MNTGKRFVSPILVPKILLISLCFLSFSGAYAYAEHRCEDACRTEKCNTIEKEAARIEACLKCLAREPADDEKAIFRWGAAKQIQDMMTMNGDDYYTKAYAFQNMRDLAANRFDIKRTDAGSTEGDIKSCLSDSSCSRDLDKLKGGNFHGNDLDLSDLNHLKTRNKEFDSRVWGAMVWELIYPGFIDNFPLDSAQQLDLLKKERELNQDNLELQGSISGLKVFEASDKSHLRRSTMTWGRGSYWALDSITSLDHFEDYYLGLKCKLPDDEKIIVDLDYEHEQGLANIILLAQSEILHRHGTPAPPSLWKRNDHDMFSGRHGMFSPNGYNKFTNPRAFELGAAKYIIRFTSSSGTSLVAKRKSFSIKSLCGPVEVGDLIESGCRKLSKLYKMGGAFTKKGFLECLVFDKLKGQAVKAVYDIEKLLRHGYETCYPKGDQHYQSTLIYSSMAINNVQNEDLKKGLTDGKVGIEKEIDNLLQKK